MDSKLISSLHKEEVNLIFLKMARKPLLYRIAI